MSRTIKNILFIMCDQLRWDYLVLLPAIRTLQTPHIDALAATRRALHPRLCAVAGLRRRRA